MPGIQLVIAGHSQSRREEALAHQPHPVLDPDPSPGPLLPGCRRPARPGNARTSAGSAGRTAGPCPTRSRPRSSCCRRCRACDRCKAQRHMRFSRRRAALEAYQVDWGHEVVLINGTTGPVKVAHVRLCRSRMLFVSAYPRETQEMVFDRTTGPLPSSRVRATRHLFA